MDRYYLRYFLLEADWLGVHTSREVAERLGIPVQVELRAFQPGGNAMVLTRDFHPRQAALAQEGVMVVILADCKYHPEHAAASPRLNGHPLGHCCLDRDPKAAILEYHHFANRPVWALYSSQAEEVLAAWGQAVGLAVALQEA